VLAVDVLVALIQSADVGDFDNRIGAPSDSSSIFATVFNAALDGEQDGGALLAYSYLSGERDVRLREGRPLFARTPDRGIGDRRRAGP
jgi:hypothetical protein